MPKEIERKFLVKNDHFKKEAERIYIRQGFLSRAKNRTIRIRIADDKAYLTIKGKSNGSVRREYEYEIPKKHAEEMMDHMCKKHIIKKYRYLVNYQGNTWEVDEFMGENEGLVVAEIELEERGQHFAKPAWVGEDVTDDPKYFNSNLSTKPYKSW